jgi:hypothetical protein
MMHNLMPAPYFGGCSSPTNEGDFLKISSSLGAKLANMHQVWRNEGIFEQAIADSGAYNCVWFYNGDSFLMVNKNGKRFVNEKRNYQDRNMAHLNWDANWAEHTNLISFLVFDNRMMENWGGVFPLPADVTTAPHVLTGATLAELADLLRERVDSLADKTGGVTLAEDFTANFEAEVAKFNGFAATGVDEDFHRGDFEYDVNTPFGSFTGALDPYPSEDQPNVAMYPLSAEGPYYAMIMAASAVDTSGGAVTDLNGQIVTWDGATIGGLYGVGNCVASPSVNAYWGAGATLGHGHIWGYAAGQHVHAQPERSVD